MNRQVKISHVLMQWSPSGSEIFKSKGRHCKLQTVASFFAHQVGRTSSNSNLLSVLDLKRQSIKPTLSLAPSPQQHTFNMLLFKTIALHKARVQRQLYKAENN